jgi:AcrR family transcriptional regulator
MRHHGNDTAERANDGERRGAGGRPTREEAERRHERIIDVAAALFMERGFEGTSMDAVADIAGVSKPTVYARYRDKRELFVAVLQRRIRHWLAPLSAAAEALADQGGPADIEATLHELSRRVLAPALSPDAAALNRILVAQALEFPELAMLAYEEGWLRAVRAIATLLQAFAAGGQIRIEDPEIAADLFLNLVLGPAVRLALYGIPTDPKAHERRRRAAVELFLNGVRVGQDRVIRP